MKKSFLLLILVLIFINSYTQKPDAVVDVLSYSFSITLSDSTDEIQGRAIIRFVSVRQTDSLLLNLVKLSAEKKGMTVIGVLEQKQPISFIHDKDLLKIKFERKLPPGTEKEIEVVYRGVPKDGLIIEKNKYGHRCFFADHWPDRARNWLPCVDHPADKAMVDFIITAPDHFQVVANGIQIEESSLGNGKKRTHYSETTPLPTKVMVIGVADFAVQLAGMVNCIPVYSWIYPEDMEKGFYDYALAVSVLPFFINNVGPYAYKKLANVQSKTRYGGLENAGAIFYFENSVTGNRLIESLFAHEIAHQWFGDMATEKDWVHVWLSEGFATYMTVLYMENKYGKDSASKILLEDRAQTIAFSKRKMRPVVDSSVTNYMELLNPNSYQKGGWVLHMLRAQLGDSLFWKSIRTYYSRYAGKNASTEDLQKVFEETSGQNLSLFFKQWLYTAGHPKLEISNTYDVGKKKLTITITQKQDPLFEFPLEIQIVGGTEDGTITKSALIKEKQTTIQIPMMEKPVKIMLDPQVKLLFEGVVQEIK